MSIEEVLTDELPGRRGGREGRMFIGFGVLLMAVALAPGIVSGDWNFFRIIGGIVLAAGAFITALGVVMVWASQPRD